ncbi:DUF3052 domain-containing protein [Propioniciclava sp.]|uniref:DUF3052 domain-containing protein n=1 Tax=Propioniciclava sp. TaxID=2038686 RepID=UPI00263698B0|nr:DUF3052 domain-containing protein [Propioniciclava sp.]
MAGSPDPGHPSRAAALGLSPGQAVQELGWDDDVDEGLRDGIMDAIDGDLVDEALEAVDAVVLWWREEDGDVADGLVDALHDLAGTGHIWLLTPKVGRTGYVDPADIAEGVSTAGLTLANPVNVSADWQAQKVVRPRAGRR